MKQLTKILTLMSFLILANASFGAPAANIQQLDWMTGNWAGNLGPVSYTHLTLPTIYSV